MSPGVWYFARSAGIVAYLLLSSSVLLGVLMAGRTTFMIAHRLTTLKSTDVLFEVEAGNITHLGEKHQRGIALTANVDDDLLGAGIAHAADGGSVRLDDAGFLVRYFT